jgi:predicted metal-binding membrane protein
MDMGTQTTLGSFPFFLGVWAAMMAAMMLPGALPAALQFARVHGRALAAPLFVASYVAVWIVVGLGVYAVYRPHGAWVAGALTIAAGVYELTPCKRSCRRRCRETARSGFEFGVYCVGSSIGLMVVLVALGVMSLTWMAVIAALVLVQKLVPPRALVDVPVALGLVAAGAFALPL